MSANTITKAVAIIAFLAFIGNNVIQNPTTYSKTLLPDNKTLLPLNIKHIALQVRAFLCVSVVRVVGVVGT